MIARTFLGFALSLLMTGSAMALGLGNASGQAILGEPLRIEIALIGSEAGLPAIACFSLRPPQTEIASTYVLRNTQLQLLGEPGRARLAVTASAPVQEPVIEFAIAVGCGFELSKDYLLLTEEPGRLATPKLPTLQPAATTLQTSQASPAQTSPPTFLPQAAIPGEGLLRIPATLSLAALARQNYPLQPKAREKFVRMMLLANPGLMSGESLIESGTELQVPAGLPLRRAGRRENGLKPAESGPAVSRPLAAPLQIPAAKSRTDRLILAAPQERNRNPAELLAEAERLAAILLEQTKTEDALTEKIGKLDDNLSDLKKHFIGLTDRLNKIEAERQAEKLAAKPASLDILELLLAVLAGGLMGALGLYLFNRRHAQGAFDPVPSFRTPAAAAPRAEPPTVPSTELNDFDLPWSKEPSGIKPAETQQGSGVVPPVAAVIESAHPAMAQNDFDFSVTTPISRPAQTIKKA